MDLTMGGQFALIPAKVLYDDKLPATAKLLYGEIYRLSYANGYCYATNRDFERLLKRSSSTVSDLLKDLADGGYIRVKQIRRNGATGDIIQRRIFCGQTLAPEDPADDSEGIPENRDTSPEKPGEGIPENRKATYLKKNNNIPPIVPQGTETWILFDRFWKLYPKKKNKEAARRAWKRLNPSMSLCRTMAAALRRQMQGEDWRRDGGQYIPYPASWLNGRRWEDEQDKPPRPAMEEQEGVTYF